MLILASIVAITVYRLAAFFAFSAKLRAHDLKELEPLKEYVTPQMATSVTASLISFVVIMILNILYERVAIWITDFGEFELCLCLMLTLLGFIYNCTLTDRASDLTELPRTKTDYENSLTLKMFLFQFVNYYSSCFYIAFFKGKAVGFPGEPIYLLGKYRNEEVPLVHLADTSLTYSLLSFDSCLVSCCPAVRSWWLSDRVDDSAGYHHGWESHMEQHPRGLATVRSQNLRPTIAYKNILLSY